VGQAHTVRQAVSAVLLASDPSKACRGDFVTGHYLRSAYGGLQGCIKAGSPSSAVANALRSYEEHTEGDHATVIVRPQGGLYDGEKLTVSLVQENGTWKVDGLKSNAPVGP
jgi:hypothetical protein